MKKIVFIIVCTIASFAAKAQVTDSTKTDTSKFHAIDQAPEYPGGFGKLFTYLKKNLKYPKEAKSNKIQGTVMVSFVVERDGSLTDIKAHKSLSPDTDAEAIRLIANSGKWLPGMYNGQPVRVQYQMPVYFRLNEY